MRIKMTARETLLMSRDEIYEVPDNIAAQIIRRGRAIEYRDEEPKKQKNKKE